MVLGPMEMEDIRLEVKTIKEDELEAKKNVFLYTLARVDGKKKSIVAEILTWIDARLESIPDTGIKAWWFRAKRRARYLK